MTVDLDDSFFEPIDPVVKSNDQRHVHSSPLKRPFPRTLTKAASGRTLLHCTPAAAKHYVSPLKDSCGVRSNGNVEGESRTDALETVTSANLRQKRRSEQGITPLRREFHGRSTRRSSQLSAKESAPSSSLNVCSSDDKQCVTSSFTDTRGTSPSLFLGLPEELFKIYAERRGIRELYDWQRQCLSDKRLLKGTNCVVCLPTGAGKTLIAEVLMLREAIVNKRSAILVLPYVAIVQEKIASLSCFEDDFNIRIEEYAASKGRIPPFVRRKGVSIFVCTIEKANMLVNSLIETNRLESVGMVVVDEIHLLGEGRRGSTMEQLLTKYMHFGSGQVIGMSATLSNIEELRQFLQAYLYVADFRPVSLQQRAQIGSVLWAIDSGGKLVDPEDLPANKFPGRDPDGLCIHLKKLIPHHQVIVFCPSKKNCENVALMIRKMLPRNVAEFRLAERQTLVSCLEQELETIEPVLKKCLMAGIAFHHAGLTQVERKLIEDAYKDGVLCVLCATSTLAAGVNLPARMVVIKGPNIAGVPLTKSRYLQMVGRAGRAGMDTQGVSITIVKQGVEERQFREMLASPMLSCSSQLLEDLAQFILDLLALKMATSLDTLMEVLRFTLLSVQTEFATLKEYAEAAVSKLIEQEMVKNGENDSALLVTSLGFATYTANMSPSDSPRLSDDLIDNLNRGLVFSSHLHLLFTISPYEVACPVNWDMFHKKFTELPQAERDLLSVCGLSEARFVQCINRRLQLSAGSIEMRMYLALILQHVWSQEPHTAICSLYGVDRGWLQNTIHASVCQASAIARFAEKMERLWPLRLLLPELIKRLRNCERSELVPLLSLDYVKVGRAQQLFQAGFRTIADVAKAAPDDLLRKLEHLSRHQAQKIVHSARSLIRDEIDDRLEDLGAVTGLNHDDMVTQIIS